MRRIPGLLAAAMTAFLLGAAPSPDPFQREYELAARTLLCDCGCSPQTIYDCACGHAAELRDEISSLIRSGRSGEDVIALWVARHGEKIRIAPTASGFNLLAWLGPGLALVAGAGLTVLLAWRWSRGSAAESPGASAMPQGDDPYVARLEQQLREYE